MNSIRMPDEKFQEMKQRLLSHAPREAAAFLLAGVFSNNSGTHFVVREVMYPEDLQYDVQEPMALQISPWFFNQVISRAEREGLAVVMCHTHPFSQDEVAFSWADDHGEAISSKTLHECLGGKPSAAMVLGQDAVSARIWEAPGKDPDVVQELRLVGRHLDIKRLTEQSGSAAVDALYSRQVMAFGSKGQAFLSSLKVGVVGVGGTGSCVAENLVRLGVRDFVLIDKDVVEPSNTTRMFGTTYRDGAAKKAPTKVDVMKRHLRAISPSAKVEARSLNVVSADAIGLLKDCDVVFSCVDRHAPRSILNELAYQCAIPVIDVGVGLSTAKERITGGTIRASIVGPGIPCMYCQGFVRSDIIGAEVLPLAEREARAREGYIPGLEEAPAVVSFTTTAAGLGVSMFLDQVIRYTDLKAPTVLLELNPFRLTRISSARGDDCTCRLREGRGDYVAFSTP